MCEHCKLRYFYWKYIKKYSKMQGLKKMSHCIFSWHFIYIKKFTLNQVYFLIKATSNPHPKGRLEVSSIPGVLTRPPKKTACFPCALPGVEHSKEYIRCPLACPSW